MLFTELTHTVNVAGEQRNTVVVIQLGGKLYHVETLLQVFNVKTGVTTMELVAGDKVESPSEIRV